jgi:hypothetical protein
LDKVVHTLFWEYSNENDMEFDETVQLELCDLLCRSVHISNNQIPEIQKRLILNGKELTFEEKLKIVNDLYNSGINSIDFSGGNLLLIDDNIKITPICCF